MFSSCICIGVLEGEACKFLRRETRTARKQHRCTECNGAIGVGETYEYVVGKWDRFETYRTCRICVAIRNDLFECSFFYGFIWSDIHEAYCLSYEDDDAYCICPSTLRQ